MTKIVIDKEYEIGKLEENVWGSFLEHMGRAVYGGIYDPNHPLADEEGFRADIKDAVREIGVPIIRYPGGNFVSGYDWKDGVGKTRSARPDIAWGQIEPNTIGLHEFSSWAEKVNAKVMMAVNLGTGTPKEAGELVEYCNFEKGTKYSDMRRENGREAPFSIKTWCLGNEMDGPWQTGAKTAEEYGRIAAEAAKIMRGLDPSIELVVCGSSSPDMPTYPEWDRIVLQHTYDYADYISLHRYYTYTQSERMEDFLSAHTDLDTFIKSVGATVDYVKAYKRSKKTVKLSIDEWNIWHTRPVFNNKDVYNDIFRDRWTVGPRRLEMYYDMADAIAFAGLVCALINNADRVKMGCLAQLVNVIAPIMTENGGRMFKQTICYPYELAIRYAKGTALRLTGVCDKMETERGETETVYSACAYENGEYTVFAINKTAEAQTYGIEFRGNEATMIRRLEMTGELHSFNDFDAPFRVVPREAVCEKGKKSAFTVKLLPYSFNVFRFKEIHS